MVGDGGRARKCQLGQAQLRSRMRRLGVEPAPHGVEHPEPIEKPEALAGADRAGERLEQMMVAVDEPRHYDGAARVERARGTAMRAILRDPRVHFVGGADASDAVALDRDRASRDLAPRGIHRDDDVGVADEERGHGTRAAMTPWRSPDWRR